MFPVTFWLEAEKMISISQGRLLGFGFRIGLYYGFSTLCSIVFGRIFCRICKQGDWTMLFHLFSFFLFLPHSILGDTYLLFCYIVAFFSILTITSDIFFIYQHNKKRYPSFPVFFGSVGLRTFSKSVTFFFTLCSFFPICLINI